jgi:ABC-2 type transport system permease protein
VLPLTTGMDALRQLLFPNADRFKLFDLGWEIVILAAQAFLFLVWAQRSLTYLERRAREEGRLTVRWQ